MSAANACKKGELSSLTHSAWPSGVNLPVPVTICHSMSELRSIHDLSTAEAYEIVARHFGHELPPLEAVENEDWGRDYVLQHFQRHSAEELAKAGLTWDQPAGP